MSKDTTEKKCFLMEYNFIPNTYCNHEK